MKPINKNTLGIILIGVCAMLAILIIFGVSRSAHAADQEPELYRVRHDCFIEFNYGGNLYRFDHSFEKAEETGRKIQYVSDLFAELVLTLEDLARAAEKKVYDLQVWIQGMKQLPAPEQATIPGCFQVLGFSEEPININEIKERFKALVKTAHPDVGGQEEWFTMLKQARDEAIRIIEVK